MRLLNVHTLEFREFYDKYIPPYGILSHTWGKAEDEVSYQDFLDLRKRRTSGLRSTLRRSRKQDCPGFKKIMSCCKIVRERKVFNFDNFRDKRPTAFYENEVKKGPNTKEALDWLWIDTICIDRSSSANLSEAINSMYAWYGYAEECYVYLSDVQALTLKENGVDMGAFRNSRWFKRGWTLQELLASKAKVFCSSNWEVIGWMYNHHSPNAYSDSYKSQLSSIEQPDLTAHVSDVTGIGIEYLDGSAALGSASIATRMCWMAGRKTTRNEDAAYCLLGIFDVNMSLVYGEGRKAFVRLQQEIMRHSGDQSIFFWNYVSYENPDNVPEIHRTPIGMLAPHAGCFTSFATNLGRSEYPFQITNLGLELRTQTRKIRVFESSINAECCLHIIELNCHAPDSDVPVEMALLECNHHGHSEFYRSRCNDEFKPHDLLRKFPEDQRDVKKSIKAFVKASAPLGSQCEKCSSFDQAVIDKIARRN